MQLYIQKKMPWRVGIQVSAKIPKKTSQSVSCRPTRRRRCDGQRCDGQSCRWSVDDSNT